MPTQTPVLCVLSRFLSSCLHPYLLCLYYGCYYYSCMSSCRPCFSPSPEQGSGHCWHPARLPNQSPVRGREGGEGERGRNKKESVEQRGRQRKHGGRGLEDGEKDLRGTEAGKKRCRMSKFHEEKKKRTGTKSALTGKEGFMQTCGIKKMASEHLVT